MVQGKERILPMDAKAHNPDLVAQRKKDLKVDKHLYVKGSLSLKALNLLKS